MIVVKIILKLFSNKSTHKQRCIKHQHTYAQRDAEGRTCIVIVVGPLEISEILNVSNVLCQNFLFEEVLHVEEEDQRRVAEEGVVADTLEQI